jgi:hypothetical protein
MIDKTLPVAIIGGGQASPQKPTLSKEMNHSFCLNQEKKSEPIFQIMVMYGCFLPGNKSIKTIKTELIKSKQHVKLKMKSK